MQPQHKDSLELIGHVSDCHALGCEAASLTKYRRSTTPKRESTAAEQVGGSGFQYLNPGLQSKHPSEPAYQVLKPSSSQGGTSSAGKGWEWSGSVYHCSRHESIKSQRPSLNSNPTRRRPSKQGKRTGMNLGEIQVDYFSSVLCP